MAENFDPYRKWLGIPPAEQPPNHYRLLGIALYEDDLDVITHAADRQMSHVRKFQSGQHGQHSQHVLNELAKARVCLLDRAQKIGYDQELNRNLGGPTRQSSAPVAARRPSSGPPAPSRPQAVAVQLVPPPAMVETLAPPVPVAVAAAPLATPVAAVASGRPVRAATARVRRKASPLPLVMAICGVAALVALAAIAAVVASGNIDEEGETDVAVETSPLPPLPEVDDAADERPARPPRERPTVPPRELPPRTTNTDDDPNQPDELIIPDNPDNRVDEDAPSLPTITREPSDDPPADDDPPQVSPPTSEEPDDEPPTDSPDEEPSDEEPSEEPTEPEVDPAIANNPQRAEKFAAAISATEDAFAQRDLKEAARQIATARRLMQGDDEESQAAALGEMMSHLGTFWRLATTGARKLQSGDELEYGGEMATFDSFSDGDVALIVGGSRLSRPLEDVELPYLIALAARGTPKPDSKSQLAIAAFLALDGNASEPDRVEQAKSALAEAVNLGGRSPALEQRFGDSPAP